MNKRNWSGSFPRYEVWSDDEKTGEIFFSPVDVTIQYTVSDFTVALEIAKDRAKFIGVEMPPIHLEKVNKGNERPSLFADYWI